MNLRLPKYLKERFGSLEAEDGLIDNCKYMLYFAKGWGLYFGECEPPLPDVPVFSKKEAIKFLKEAIQYEEE